MDKNPSYKELEKRIVQLEQVEIESKKTKKALEEALTRYRTLFESANDAIFFQKGNAFIECNRKTLEMFGCRDDQIIGLNHYDFSPEYQPDGVLSRVKGAGKMELAKKGIPQVFEWRHCKYDGTPFDSEVSLNKVELKGEVFIQGIVRDVTQRKQAEQELRAALSEIERLKKQLEADYTYLQEELKLSHNFEEIIGQSDALKSVLYKVEQIAPTDATVLLLGETGVGKELFARAIHNASSHRERPLVKVNCATLPPNLIESELFGHEKGAFTGAESKRIGRFELAHGTTIFLDEVGELPPALQVKLLRVLQDGEFERVGSSHTTKVNVRVIAATNRNLEEEVRKSTFREDLWYRLNIFPITVPPLRERKEDITLLVNWFVNKYANNLRKRIEKIPLKTMQALQNYHWPGNIRELENVIERAVINTQGSVITILDRLETFEIEESASNRKKRLIDIERDHIIQILEETKWKVSGKKGAAAVLGLNPSTLRGRMRKLGIRRP